MSEAHRRSVILTVLTMLVHTVRSCGTGCPCRILAEEIGHQDLRFDIPIYVDQDRRSPPSSGAERTECCDAVLPRRELVPKPMLRLGTDVGESLTPDRQIGP